MTNDSNSVRKLSELLVKNKIIKFGSFTLKSGKKSWFYIDLRLIPSYPELFQFVISCYEKLLSKISNVEGVAGVAVAGIPFSSVLGYKLSLPSLIVRPQPKEHGLKKQVEGVVKQGANIVLIDDLITTGGSKIPSIEALRDEGYTVQDLVVLIDRSENEIKELTEKGVKLYSYTNMNQIFQTCLELAADILPENKKELIRSNWKKKNNNKSRLTPNL